MTEFSTFKVDFKRRSCPSAPCASAANAIGSDIDMLNGTSVSVNMID